MPQAETQPVTCHPQVCEPCVSIGAKCVVQRPAGFTVINPSPSMYQRIDPKSYSYGFDRSGRIVGVNTYVPYPGEYPKYHELNIERGVEWLTEQHTENINKEDVAKKAAEDEAKRLEIAEYFTAENDDGYNEWAAKKEEERHKKEEMQKELSVVPKEIKDLAGHVKPSRTETTNQTYGMYLDLLPKYPAVYPLPEKLPYKPLNLLVKFRKSNISDHPLIPDHSFAVDPRTLVTKDGCYTGGIRGAVHLPEIPGVQNKTPYTFRPSAMNFGETIGERQKGFTWPIYSATGLELNRPLRHCVSVISGVNSRVRVRADAPAHAVPRIYNRYMSYGSYPGADSETEVNPATKVHRKFCAPCTPYPPRAPTLNPCSHKFLAPPNFLTKPELRKPPC